MLFAAVIIASFQGFETQNTSRKIESTRARASLVNRFHLSPSLFRIFFLLILPMPALFLILFLFLFLFFFLVSRMTEVEKAGRRRRRESNLYGLLNVLPVAFDANTRGQHNLGKVTEIRAERLDYPMSHSYSLVRILAFLGRFLSRLTGIRSNYRIQSLAEQDLDIL